MDIQDWCRQSGLSNDTTLQLRREGLVTAEDLRGVTEDDVRVTFQELRKLPLQQCVALREALRDLHQGKARRRHREAGVSIADWSARHGLDAETRKVLEVEGFATADNMKYVTEYDVRTTFQKKGRLPLHQCIALRKALENERVSHQRTARCDDNTIIRATEEENGGRQMNMSDSTDTVKKSFRPCARPRLRTTHTHRTATEGRGELQIAAVDDQRLQGTVTTPPSVADNIQRLGRRARSAHAHDSEGEYRVVVVGSEGSGKSQTVQSILGYQGQSILGPQGETASGRLFRGPVRGHYVQILDSSGWLDSSRQHSHTAAVITTELRQLHPGPHAVLYTVDVSSRYTKENSIRFRQLDAIFNHQLHPYLIVVFTHGDSLRGKPLQDLLHTAPRDLKHVLSKCGDRYILLDNTNRQQNQNQVDTLLHLLQEVRGRNVARPCLPVAGGGEEVEQMVQRLMEVDEEMMENSSLVQSRRQQEKESVKQIKRSRKVLEKRESQISREQRELDLTARELENAVKNSSLS